MVFSGACIVSEQKPETRLLQHMIVNRYPLVRKRVDAGNFGGESRVR